MALGKDPSQNYIGLGAEPLARFFHPKSIAVIGAKDDEGSVGKTLLANLIATYKGEIYPVNPKREKVLGLKCYKTVPENTDLAVIATPAKTVPGIIKNLSAKAVIIISAGFKEIGDEGLKLEEEITRLASQAGIRIIGPNCIGLMNPITGLNATFAKGIADPGNLAFVSQSGAMCTAVLDWSLEEHIGFSAFVSIGSMCDVGWGDLIRYLGNDPHTDSILIYMETVGDPREFLSAAREIALEKPIIVIKGGRSTESAKAAASHTGSLAGSDEVFDAALERAGVLRVNTIAELFDTASLLAKQPLPKGDRLAIITNAGGPSVLATDAAVFSGAVIGPISTVDTLSTFLPKAWSHSNPVDILGDADPKRFADTLAVLKEDPEVDGILIILSPQDMTNPTGCAEAIMQESEKPLLASWMGGSSVKEGIRLLNAYGIPTFSYPDDAAKAFGTMCRYRKTLQALYETPTETPLKNASAQKIILTALSEGRTLLTEDESKRLLDAYGIPVVETLFAKTPEEAVRIAEKIGFPVVLKLFSKTITHKSDVGGVKLNLKNREEVLKAFQEINSQEGVTVQKMIKHKGYELILGSSTDPQFGPVILFGAGGELVEIFKDKAIGLPPLTETLAKLLIQKTKISGVFEGFRGRPPVNRDELANLLVRFSVMIAENPRIKECDINPLIASHEGMIALDARVVLHESESTPKMAIRPYPKQYVKEVTLKSGEKVTLRPILPEDIPLMTRFHKDLSQNSVRQRYFEFLTLSDRIARERLVKICFNDYEHEIGVVAEHGGNIIGAARLSKVGSLEEGTLSLIIQDAWQGSHLGSLLVKHLIHIAREEKWQRLAAHVLNENAGMLHILQKNGFQRIPTNNEIETLVLDL